MNRVRAFVNHPERLKSSVGMTDGDAKGYLGSMHELTVSLWWHEMRMCCECLGEKENRSIELSVGFHSWLTRQRYTVSTPSPFFFSFACEMFSMALHQVVLGLRLRDAMMRTYMRVHSHALTVYTLIILLLMNYKRTLRPYTYTPLLSGLQPNDRPHSGKIQGHTITPAFCL